MLCAYKLLQITLVLLIGRGVGFDANPRSCFAVPLTFIFISFLFCSAFRRVLSFRSRMCVGGQYSNLMVQCKSMGIWDKWEGVLDMYRDVNQLFGDIVKVPCIISTCASLYNNARRGCSDR